jgi:hypothetical protein
MTRDKVVAGMVEAQGGARLVHRSTGNWHMGLLVACGGYARIWDKGVTGDAMTIGPPEHVTCAECRATFAWAPMAGTQMRMPWAEGNHSTSSNSSPKDSAVAAGDVPRRAESATQGGPCVASRSPDHRTSGPGENPGDGTFLTGKQSLPVRPRPKVHIVDENGRPLL